MNKSIDRRSFIAGSFASAASLAGCKCPFGCARKPIALQLWSINKIMWKSEDPAVTLRKVKDIGFDGVEFAGFGGRTAKDVAKLLADSGLRGMGSHTSGIAQFTGDALKRNLDFCAEAGIESLTNAYAKFNTADDWVKFGVTMGEAADTAAKWGIPVSVHNHCHEFTQIFDGVYAWDLVFRNASEKLNQQIDTSQVVNPGLDCVERIRKYHGRNFSVHMKENVPSQWGLFGVAPDGGGKRVPFEDVVACLEDEPGFSWYVIECERKPDSLLPAKCNFKYLSSRI